MRTGVKDTMGETRKLAAIMAIDVVGYSRLMGTDEAGTARAVREHREAAAPIVAGLGGRLRLRTSCRQRSKPAAKPWSIFAITWAADRAANAAEIVVVEKAGVAIYGGAFDCAGMPRL